MLVLKRKKSWYKNKLCISFVLPILIAIPFLINEIYKWGNSTGKGYYTLWGADDMLSFYGAILSVIGTVYLGYVAIKQNDRIMQIEEKIYNRDCSSDIVIKNAERTTEKFIPLSNEEPCEYENGPDLELELTNYGNSILTKIGLDFGHGKVFTSHIVLPKDCTKYVFISTPKNIQNKSLVKCTFFSCNQVCTYGDFVLETHLNVAKCTHYHYYGLYNEKERNDLTTNIH